MGYSQFFRNPDLRSVSEWTFCVVIDILDTLLFKRFLFKSNPYFFVCIYNIIKVSDKFNSLLLLDPNLKESSSESYWVTSISSFEPPIFRSYPIGKEKVLFSFLPNHASFYFKATVPPLRPWSLCHRCLTDPIRPN